jgi:hypothetical protein
VDIKKYNRTSYIILTIAFVLFLIGLIRYFVGSSEAAMNLATRLPTVRDGSMTFILGAGGIAVGIYRLTYKKKIIKKHTEWEKKQEKKTEKKNRLTGIR